MPGSPARPRRVHVIRRGDNSGPVLAADLGVREMRWSSMVWGGGGGGAAAAIGAAAAAVATGQASCVVTYRGMTQTETGRLGFAKYYFDNTYLPHGVATPAQVTALRTQRMLEADGVPRSAMRNLVLAAYQHAQNNPTAAGYGRPLTAQGYDSSPLIVEPYHLFDCSRENDGAVALIVVSAERARELGVTPAYVLAAAQGAPGGYAAWGENDDPYTSAGLPPGPQVTGWPRGCGRRPRWPRANSTSRRSTRTSVAPRSPRSSTTGCARPARRRGVHDRGEPHRSGGCVAGQHLGRQYRRLVRQRDGAGRRGGAADSRDVSEPGAGCGHLLFIGGPMAPLVSSVLLGSDRTL